MENYYEIIDRERHRIFDSEIVSGKDMNFFLLTSANLYNLLPKIPIKDHISMIKGILFNQSLSIIEQINEDVINKCKMTGYVIEKKKLPAIFCSFHLGSYRLIISHLAKIGIPVSLVVSSNVLAKQGKEIEDSYAKISGDKLTIINSNSHTSILQMTRELKKGKSLFVYIDGNSGVGGVKKESEGLLKISLLGKPFFARKGVAFLSHFAAVPIIPIICYRHSIEDIIIEYFEPITPSYEDREEYCEKTTFFIYSNFAEYLKKYPEQWEGWLYLHKYLDIKNIPSELGNLNTIDMDAIQMKFNTDRYGFITNNSEILLFDRCTYQSYLIDRNTYDFLKNGAQLDSLDKQELKKLIIRQIII